MKLNVNCGKIITVRGEELEEVEHFKYPGSFISAVSNVDNWYGRSGIQQTQPHLEVINFPLQHQTEDLQVQCPMLQRSGE